MGASRTNWNERAQQFVKSCMGRFGAGPDEFITGYIDDFQPVYATPEIREDEPQLVWFVFPEGKVARIVNEILPGVFVDHEGNVFEYEGEVVRLGTITRLGEEPLLTLEMVRR